MTTPLSIHKLFATLLTIVAVFAGQQAFATSTFTVSSSSYNNTQGRFKITRTGNTTVAETVDYRTVSLSAIAGIHFTEKTGTVTFNPNDTYKYIYVDETAIANVDANYRYQNGTSRKYRFEVLDKDGSLLASKDRTISYGSDYQVTAADFDEKTLTVNSGETTVVDGGYRNNPYCSMEGSSYYNTAAPAEYLSAINAELRMTLTLQAKEVDDGYQYIQVLFDQDGNNDCDERPTSNISDGNPGTPSRSLYMTGFEHKPGSKNTTYASYSFPVTSVGNNASADAPWNISPWNNSIGKLSIQKFKSNSDRASDGRLIAPTSFTTLDIRFNASGSGDDDWISNNIEAHIQAVTTPTVLNNYKVSGGRHQKGNTVYVSVSFSEIVNITGSTKKLTTSWGDLTYIEGNGTNVLTFKGEISSSASGSFNVTGYSGNINDLAGNAFTGSISHNFGTSLDSDYVWSTSDFNSLGSNTYEIATTTDLLHLAYLVNKSSTQNNCSGLTFKQTYDIAYTHGTSTTETNFTQIGGYFNSTDGDRDFCGTYDGQGHTISGIRLYKNPNNSSNVNKNVGLFGRITGATIQNVILTDASFTGYRIVGGIVGNANSGGTVQNCLVVGSTITCGDTYAGVIVGRDPGTLTANYYRDCTVTLGGTSYTTNVAVSANSGSATQDVNGARSVHTLTIQNELVTASGETVTYQDVAYYISNTTVTLAYNNGNTQGYQITYSLNGTALSGNTFTMPAADATVDATAPVIPWTGDGSAETPYIITTLGQLDLLAERVNSGTGDEYAADGYSGKYFVLGADITYTHTTDWNDAASTENNYTAIGSNSHPFKGNFDGQNYSISGLRIYKKGYNQQGLFGKVNSGTVKRVHLANARITGESYVGGIAGNSFLCTVEDCTVADNVAIHAVANSSSNHGGIVGGNQGIVQRCISHATLSVASNMTGGKKYGGVVGNNYNNGNVKDCLAIGATVPNVDNRGAIVGENNNNTNIILQRNYYRNCTVAGIANATDVGCDGADIIADQGALALYTLTLPDNVTTDRTASATLPGTGNKTYTTGADIDGTPYYCQGGTVTLVYNNLSEGYQTNYTATGGTINGNILTMPAANVTVTVALVPDWSGNGTQNSPYLITTTAQLNALAAAVNNGTSYNGYFFKLGADITYDGTENNYTPIGTSSNKFKGTFDGDGYTVSGIHINTNGDYQGLFGYVYGGTVSNVTLRSSTITGFAFVGGIVGYLNDGSVTDCRVEGTVTIGSYNNSSSTRLGGIIGQVDGNATVNGCISAATVTDNDKSNCFYFGGIVGYLYSGTVSNNIALGANVSANSFKGAIVGYANSNNLAHNYYHDCTVGGATTNVGTPSGDVSENDGAVQVFSLSLGEGITATPAPAVTCDSINYYTAGATVTFGYSGTVPTGQMPVYSVNGTDLSGNTFTMPAGNVTVTVIFAPISYNVHFVAVGHNEGSQTAFEGDEITLPGSVSVNVNGWTFSGWVDAELAETVQKPVFFAPGASYTVTANATLYALYTRTEGGIGEPVYELITEAPSDWSGNYVITNGETESSYVLKGVAATSGGTNAENSNNCTPFASSGITLTDNVLDNVADDYVMTLEAQGSYYTLYNAAVGTYYGMNSSSYLYAYGSYNATYCNWTPGMNDSHGVSLKNAANGSYPYFSFSINNNYFWSGSSTNANVLRLWKENNGDGVYYTTDPTVSAPAVPVESIVVNPDETEMNVDATYTILYTVLPADATNKAVTFTSSDENVATVNANGDVTGVAAGITTITIAATDGSGVTGTFTVTVTNIDVEEIYVFYDDIAIFTGESATISYTVAPNNATNKDVTFTSANTAIATVDADGVVTGVGAGETIITIASVSNPEVIADVTVSVTAVGGSGTWAQMQFINQLMLIGNYEGELIDTYVDVYQEDGWTLVDYNLNSGTNSDQVIYLLYKTGLADDPDHAPITDFYIKSTSDQNDHPDEISYNNRKYFRITSFEGSNSFMDSYGDLNYGAGGKYIYLYYTTDAWDYPRGVSEISFDNNSDGAVCGNGGTAPQDLNEGTPGDNIYMHYKVTETYTLEINGYTSQTTGWRLIASPLNGEIEVDDVEHMQDNTFDLYRFNQGVALEWENWKQTGNHQHFNLEPGRGYLYANSANETLYFVGTPYSGNGEVTLTKTSGADLEGWNLVGNPFADTAYLQGNVAFYMMNDGGSEIVTANRNYVEPMEGIFVVADTDGETLTFSITAPSKGRGQAHEPEQIVINLSTLNAQRSTSIIDRAIVRFDDGPQLPKFQLDPNHTKVYIPQDGKDYAVVNANGMGELPVNFKAKENGEYTLTISESLNSKFSIINYLHLIDNLTGADVDLLATPTYTFTATTHDDALRFRLVFNASAERQEGSE